MKTEVLLDTRCTVETPEGIEFSSSLAGPVPRVLAYAVDFLWRTLFFVVIAIIAGFLGELGTGLVLITVFILEWIYPVFFEIFRNGQTPGKKAFGLQVVNDDFTPVGWGGACIRNLLRAADFLPSFYTFGLVSIVISRKFQRLGDLAAGTLVIYIDQEQQHAIPEGIQGRPSKMKLTSEEQRTIASFVMRSPVLTESRQTELANIVEPLTGASGSKGLAILKAIGAWQLGKK